MTRMFQISAAPAEMPAVRGMRTWIYNAMSLAGVEAMVNFMKDFERSHG